MSLGIGGGYSVLVNYQLLQLKYRSIIPSSPFLHYLSQLNRQNGSLLASLIEL